MDRLSALDASFLYGETPESPMHVAGLAIFEPPPAASVDLPDACNPRQCRQALVMGFLVVCKFVTRRRPRSH